jgi:stage II sporulation protein AA (anti-sigma F factor antagonist)
MTDATVEADTTGPVVRLVVKGEVDLSNAEEVERAMMVAISNEATGVSIDLSGVDYLDSAGLRILYALGVRLEILQITLEVVAPVDSVARHVIELTGLASVVQLVPSAPPRPVLGP